MSRLFDALQRSESERSGVDLSALSAATEVLKLAELHAGSERETALQFEQSHATASPERNASLPQLAVLPVATASPERNASLPQPAVPPVATAVEDPPIAELSPSDKHLDQFRQFQSLEIVLPPQNRLVCLTDNQSLVAEKFRFLGLRLQHLRRDRPLKKVLITSTIPQEGKSMVSGNLACTLAQRTQQKTLVVEGDVRRPALSQMFGLGRIPGLCELLQGERSLTSSVYHLKGPDLWILPAGSAPKNPMELLQSGRLSDLMDQLTELFDWIIVDSPPLLPLADTSVWMRLVDGILLVARQGITEKRQLERGLEALEPKKVIGALLNGSKSPVRSDYYYTTGRS